ncbi:MAG: hypothetical protein LBJ81_02970, partial [Puniceicoccales bacterium]|nr:hypothetical protein [Puniceicoccales bacterium]
FYRAEGNCATPFLPKFAAKAAKLMASVGASSRMPLSVLNRFWEVLISLTIGTTEVILEKFPKKSVFDISAEVVKPVAPHIFPVISAVGQLWGFANGLKSESSFAKMLKTAIQDSEVIMAQISKAKEKKSSGEEDSEGEEEKDSKKKKKKKAPSSAKNFAGHIITQLQKITAKYFDIFFKRETFGNLAPPR